MIDRFVNFFLFDSHFNELDQSPGDIIYYRSNDDLLKQDSNLRFIATGVITTINSFCKLFGEEYCDYMITNDCENAFLPIGEDLYFYVSLKLQTKQPTQSYLAPPMITNLNLVLPPSHIFASNTRKIILKNVLTMIKNILFLNIQQPKRSPNGKFPDIFKDEVNVYLPKILDLINWNNLSYTHIWKSSVFIAKLPKMTNIEYLNELKSLQNQNEFIYGLILTNKNKVIAYTTEQELANILNFLVKKKYKVYYPYKLKKKVNSIHYVIGIINHENGCIKNKLDTDDFMSVVTPPLLWKDQTFALVALKYNNVKLIAVIDLKNVDLENDLTQFQSLAEPLLRKCDLFNDENNTDFENLKEELNSRFKKNSGAKLSCNFRLNTIQILANKIAPNEMDLIINGILFSNEANLFIKKELMKKRENKEENDDETECFIPFNYGFYLYFEQRNKKYSNMFMKTKQKSFSNSLELFHMINEII